jgi:hypothetical protein
MRIELEFPFRKSTLPFAFLWIRRKIGFEDWNLNDGEFKCEIEFKRKKKRFKNFKQTNKELKFVEKVQVLLS